MKVFDSGNDLLENPAGFWFFDLCVLNDEIKELATICIFHDKEELFWSFDDLIELDEIGVSDHFEDVDFSLDSFDV